MWQSLDIAGHPVEVFEPVGRSPAHLLIFLHDQDGLTLNNPATTAWLDQTAMACACPLAGPIWWSDRVSAQFDSRRSVERWLLDDVLPHLLAAWRLSPKAVALAGVGMGGQGALRLGFKYPERFPVVAALDAALDHHELYGEGTALDEMYSSREHCRQDTAILHIHPARQPTSIWFAADPAGRWFRGNDRLDEKLSALGVEHHFLPRRGDLIEMLDWLANALREQERRLL